jgi:hypothetical protein
LLFTGAAFYITKILLVLLNRRWLFLHIFSCSPRYILIM